MKVKAERLTRPSCLSISSFILHPSAFYPSAFILCSPAVGAKKLLHQLAALFFQHAGSDFNSMIQEIRVANAKPRFDRAGSFIDRAINQPLHSRLNQSAGAHRAGFDRGINNSVCQPVVAELLRGFAQRDDFRVSSRIPIGARSVSGN